MYLSINGRKIKMDPLPVEVWEAIDSAENTNDTISLYKKDDEYLEAILNINNGYQLKYNNNEGTFKTKMHSIDEKEVEKIFNSYYYDNLDWKKHFRWEKKSPANQIKNTIIILLGLVSFIFFAMNGFSRDAVIDKTFKFFEGFGVNPFLIPLLVWGILIYSDFDYIRNYKRITGSDKSRVTWYFIIVPFLLLAFIISLFKK